MKLNSAPLRAAHSPPEALYEQCREKKTYTCISPPPFSKKAMQWAKKWPVPMNLPFFAVEAYVLGGVQNQAEKKKKKAFRPVPVPKSTFPAVGITLH